MSSIFLLASIVFALFAHAFRAEQPAPVPPEPVVVEARSVASCCWWNGRKWICRDEGW